MRGWGANGRPGMRGGELECRSGMVVWVKKG